MRKQRRKLGELGEGGSLRGSGGKHQTRSLKASERDVNPVAVLEPNLALPAPVDDLLPEAKYPFRWLLGTHVVRAKAEVPNEAEVGEGVLPEEGVDLFDQGEERGVQVVVVVGKFGVEEAGIDIADGDELKSGVGREKNMRRYPIGRFPMPFGVRGTDELAKILTPIGERDGCDLAGVSQIVFFDRARGVSELKLRDLPAVLLKEHREPFPSVTEVRGEDGNICEERHVPRREDAERGVVQAEF